MQERRKHQRLTFSDPNRPIAELQFLPSSSPKFTARLKDISEGGIGFIIPRHPYLKIDTGTRLILRQVSKLPPLSFLHDLALEVMWLFDFKSLEHIAFGCRFVDASTEISEKIKRFVSRSDQADSSS